MGIIDYTFVHSCNVLRDTVTGQNAAGTPIKNIVSTAYNCFFTVKSSTFGNILNSESGKVVDYSIIAFLPSDAVVNAGDSISTTEPNWAGTYEVQSVDAPEIPFSGTVDHKEAYLNKVVKRG